MNLQNKILTQTILPNSYLLKNMLLVHIVYVAVRINFISFEALAKVLRPSKANLPEMVENQ